jgi:ABC-type multidrug transport system fused ATPase/permease subunit
MALVETAGVASLMPFLAVLGNPGIVESNSALASIYSRGGFTSRDEFLFTLGLAALAIVVGAAIFRAGAQYVILSFVNMRRYSISVRLFNGYLGQPYAFFLNRNSADLTKRTLSDVDMLVENVLMPGVQLVAYAIVAAMIVALLIVIDPLVASAVLVVIGGFYSTIYVVSRRALTRTGRDRNLANRQRFTQANEAFGGIKEIKLFGREKAFAERFRGPAFRFARHKAVSDTIALVPRYLIEAVAFGGALAMALLLMKTRRNLGDVLPILGLYAFAGYRLLPAVQNIFNGLTRLRFGLPIVESVAGELRAHIAGNRHRDDGPVLQFQRFIRFDKVTYRYPGVSAPAIDSVDLAIAANTTVGFIGKTGAGKTTAVDLILGLLEPTEGRVLIDDEPLTDSNRRAWQRNIGYVPQAIFLADASVAENVAFGIPLDRVDRTAVERAARTANVHDFVMNELARGYDTEIGERGVRLSGGQRQRIGIARALYYDPPVLVFDEATSALDTATEQAVMEAIGNLQGAKTIIIIAHRLTTVEGCDKMFRFEAGKAQVGE